MSARARLPMREIGAWLACAAVIAGLEAGCSLTPASGTTGPAVVSSAPSASTQESASSATLESPPTPTAEASTVVRASASPDRTDAPPSASMRAEGGDPVTGQLGSYTWADGGSDSPWLPGSPITVGAGEPLTVVLASRDVVADWSAARVAPGTTDGTSAVSLGSAEGEPIRFLAPDRGRWSVKVQVRFGGGSDDAAYYWLLDVR